MYNTYVLDEYENKVLKKFETNVKLEQKTRVYL